MTYFLDFRQQSRAGSVLSTPNLLSVNGLVNPALSRSIPEAVLQSQVSGRELVLATHGFNVSRKEGIHALARLERALELPARFVFVGVLWPGDFWIPVINYPAEAEDAVRCGRHLARFVNTKLRGACHVSFVSHSLGGRLVLEAVKNLQRRAREVCVLAAAVDDNCLTSRQYLAARKNADRVTVLASRGDTVLRLAYLLGDFASDITYDDDSAFRRALGFHGPRPSAGTNTLHAQVPEPRHGHGDYLPPSNIHDPESGNVQRVSKFISETLLGVSHTWP